MVGGAAISVSFKTLRLDFNRYFYVVTLYKVFKTNEITILSHNAAKKPHAAHRQWVNALGRKKVKRVALRRRRWPVLPLRSQL